MSTQYTIKGPGYGPGRGTPTHFIKFKDKNNVEHSVPMFGESDYRRNLEGMRSDPRYRDIKTFQHVGDRKKGSGTEDVYQRTDPHRSKVFRE